MKKDKIIVFILEISLIIILFFALFASNIFTRQISAIIISIYAFIVSYFLKKRKISSINKDYVFWLMVVFSMFYLGLFYLLGLHFGFVKSKILLSLSTIWKFILPLGAIIVSSEVMRRIFLSHKIELTYRSKKFEFSVILTFIAMVMMDLLIYTEVYNLAVLDDFFLVLGFVFFSSLSCNLLYNYITSRYGSKGIVVFRLITILFVYIIPIVPDVYIFFRTFLRLLYPYLIYLVMEKNFSKNDYTMSRSDKKKELISNTALIGISAVLVMLISCQFRYGIIVVGSGSMTGSIDMGDAVVFEKYDKQEIELGQVIIFDYNGMKTIHRVVDIQKVDGEWRYYTKGDANALADNDYRLKKDVEALVMFKVKYIGYPTLFIRSIFLED